MSETRTEIPLAVVGCDFRVVSSRCRSLLVLQRDEAREVAEGLARIGGGEGFADLNTCNRNEWIVSASDPRWAAGLLQASMLERLRGACRQRPQPYVFTGSEAARHIFRVAIGRESLVVGERQIAGQLFRALDEARTRGTSSRVLNGLGAIAGRLVQIAERRSILGGRSRGVHGLAVRLLRERFAGDGRRPVAVIGTGEIGRRVRDLLEADPHFAPRAVNRTIAEEDRGRVAPLAELPGILGQVEAVVVCTSAPQPLIGPAQLAGHPEGRPLLIIDLGIPEQVVRQGLPEGVERLGLDDLTLLPDTGAPSADEPDAEEMVERAVAEFERFCREPAYSEIFDAVGRNHRRLVAGEIPRLLSSLPQLGPAERARLEAELDGIISGYTNDLFRTLREAAAPSPDKDGESEAS